MTALGKRILIVEDEEILARNLHDFFARRRSAVQLAASGEEAIARAQAFAPDLIVLDYALPGIDGLTAFELIRRFDPLLPAILVTGHPSSGVAASAHALGIAHVLTKPFSLADLDRAIESALDGATTQPEGPDRQRAGVSAARDGQPLR
jgi:CheY-like chemotaxis protein